MESSPNSLTDEKLTQDRIIAIMLGQLEMDVDECISAYIKLMRTVFADMLHSARPGISAGNVRPRFDSEVLRAAIATVIESKGRSPEDLFTHGETSGCRVYCAPHALMANLGKLTQPQFRVCCFEIYAWNSADSELRSG